MKINANIYDTFSRHIFCAHHGDPSILCHILGQQVYHPAPNGSYIFHILVIFCIPGGPGILGALPPGRLGSASGGPGVPSPAPP